MSTACLSCGACCAVFRVAFHWSETEPFLGGQVPVHFTTKLDPHRVAMLGTAGGTSVRCTALAGTVGETVQCSIYPQRPSPCRELAPDGQDGIDSPQCRTARARYGLSPLPASGRDGPEGPRDLPTPRSA